MPGWSATEREHIIHENMLKLRLRTDLCVEVVPFPHTRTKKNNGFQVGVFIRIGGQFGHAVAELLHPPYVLHDKFTSFWGQFFCMERIDKKTPEIEKCIVAQKLNSTWSSKTYLFWRLTSPFRITLHQVLQEAKSSSYLPVGWSADGW